MGTEIGMRKCWEAESDHRIGMAGAAPGPGKHEKEPLNEVHQNAIWREHVAKEQRHQKLYTHFLFNPFKEREWLDC